MAELKASFIKSERLAGSVAAPPDKSVSHRCAIIASLSDGECGVRRYSTAADCLSTVRCLRELGVRVSGSPSEMVFHGVGVGGYTIPSGELDAGNSGTTMRLLAGAVATCGFEVSITGDRGLRNRPMARVIEPLVLMGAQARAADREGHPPLYIKGGTLSGIRYSPPVASAQVKSALLLAGLGAAGDTTVCELFPTRDHTERLLRYAGVAVRREGDEVSVSPGPPSPFDVVVPGDISSAAFLLSCALLCPGSDIEVLGVGVNPTRTRFLDIIRKMGADVEVRTPGTTGWEPVADIRARYSTLAGVELGPEDVAGAIDEIPLIALLATAAEGTTFITGASELRVKESDRIASTVAGLRALGADIVEEGDGMVIQGPVSLIGAEVGAGGDHRLALMLACAGLAAAGTTTVSGWEWSGISFPGFAGAVASLGGRAVERS